MINDKIKDILRNARVKALEQGVKAYFSYHYEKSHLMRIGNNSVSLSTSEELTRLDIEVLDGKKAGSHTQLGDITSIEYAEKALQIAIDKAKVAVAKDYQPLAAVVEENFLDEDQFDEELMNLDPAFKAENYKKIFNEVGDDYNFSGSWSSGYSERFVLTTETTNEGLNKMTDQQFSVVLKHPEKLWELTESQTGYRKTDFKVDAVIKNFKLLTNVYENNDGFEVKPGKYTIMFGPTAIAEVLQMAVYTGFEGRGYEEKQGWTARNKIGEKILGENITLTDDPADKNTFKASFDMTGRKRSKFPLVENGIFKNIMYGSFAAAKYDKKPTSHDLGNISIVLKTGNDESCPIEATKGMGRVLYIPALHYINLPNPSEGIFTGSSRFNALLIEDGKVVSPIFSSRVTDTFQAVFNNVKKLSPESVSVNLSNTYGRRSPVAFSVPEYIISEGVKITDCAESF